VVLIEAGTRLMSRASLQNQARVHNGYHYPRSLLTALRSRVNFPRFCQDYRDCVVSSFAKLYAVARRYSHVNAKQFKLFCERVGAPVRPAAAHHQRLFDNRLVEAVYDVTEYAFDAERLRVLITQALEVAGVEVRFETEAERVAADAAGLRVWLRNGSHHTELTAPAVFNCTYARTNQLLVASGLPPIALKHELTEMALVEPPVALEGAGITLMCGPFFSIMPFPSRGLHSFSHVRYTPHYAWHDRDAAGFSDPYKHLHATPASNFVAMRQDAQRFVPALAGCVQRDSLWEVKTLLPRSEADDSRPILYYPVPQLPGLTCVMGSKIDNIYDMFDHEAEAAAAVGGWPPALPFAPPPGTDPAREAR